MVAIEISKLATLRTRDKPRAELTTSELIARGYWALQRGNTRESLSAALSWFNEALQREPHNVAALLAVARVHVSGHRTEAGRPGMHPPGPFSVRAACAFLPRVAPPM
jgi:hypothetical protein